MLYLEKLGVERKLLQDDRYIYFEVYGVNTLYKLLGTTRQDLCLIVFFS